MKTVSPISPELETKLKNSDPEIQAFVDALQAEIRKLLKEKAKLEANNILLNERINMFEAGRDDENAKQREEFLANISKEDLVTITDILKKYEK